MCDFNPSAMAPDTTLVTKPTDGQMQPPCVGGMNNMPLTSNIAPMVSQVRTSSTAYSLLPAWTQWYSFHRQGICFGLSCVPWRAFCLLCAAWFFATMTPSLQSGGDIATDR
ncbi:hypothetical protein M405DRAFT_55921 [Rhizopogon salebrosus TDB-379]|nr:hypothetical protein M405DRAFT_55921 [Rhizopogon salebrosus TDB-379]